MEEQQTRPYNRLWSGSGPAYRIRKRSTAWRVMLATALTLPPSALRSMGQPMTRIPSPQSPSQSIRLWDSAAPGAEGETVADIPRIDVYLPEKNPTHTGVLVCPGGGYHYLAMSNEGWPIAVWLNTHGIAAFVLHYRVKPYGYPFPLLDGERAMRLLRSRFVSRGTAAASSCKTSTERSSSIPSASASPPPDF